MTVDIGLTDVVDDKWGVPSDMVGPTYVNVSICQLMLWEG